VIVNVYNRTDRPGDSGGIYLVYSHGAGVLHDWPGPGFPSNPIAATTLQPNRESYICVPLDQVKLELAGVRTKTGNLSRIEVNKVRVDLASGRRLWREAKLGHL
jgi:hypothetical protein